MASPAPRGCLSGYGYVVQRKGINARDSINPHLEVDLGVKQQLRRGEERREECRVDDGTTPTAVWCGSWTAVVEEKQVKRRRTSRQPVSVQSEAKLSL